MRWLVVVFVAACASVAPRVAPTPVARELRDLTVTDDDFYRPMLYSWTTPASIRALRTSHRLLVATAASGTFVSPFNRVLAPLAAGTGDAPKVARVLTTRLVRRRYAWPAPFATVLGLGPRTYGNALIRIELRPDAWIGRFDPDAREPFAFVDASHARVPIATVLASPERIGAIFHVRTHDVDPRFREYIVCNEAMVARWSIATPEIRAELAAEIDLVRSLRDRWIPRAELVAPAVPSWSGRARTTVERWRAALAFDNARYRPTVPNLDAIVAALAAYDGAGEPLVVAPN